MADEHVIVVLHQLYVHRCVTANNWSPNICIFRMARSDGDAFWSDVTWTEILYKYGQRTPIGTIQQRLRKRKNLRPTTETELTEAIGKITAAQDHRYVFVVSVFEMLKHF